MVTYNIVLAKFLMRLPWTR